MFSDDVGLWDETDQFFYDVLNLPNDHKVRLRIRSMVGLIPLFAVETLEPEMLDRLPGFRKRLEWFLNHRPDLASLVSHWESPGRGAAAAVVAAARPSHEAAVAAHAG